MSGLGIDNDDSIWVATFGDGLYRLKGEAIENFKDSLPNPYVSALTIDQTNNKVYFSVVGGKLADGTAYEGGLYSFSNGKFELVSALDNGKPSSKIRVLANDKDGNTVVYSDDIHISGRCRNTLTQ
jgi:ligand-binding sensor domain-containing protein